MKTKLALIFILPALLVTIISLLFISNLTNNLGIFNIPDEVIFPALFYFSILPPFIFSEYYLLLQTKHTFSKKLYLTFPVSLAILTVLIAEFFYGISINFEYFYGRKSLGTIIIAVVLGGGVLMYGYIRLGLQHWLREFFQKIMAKFFTFIYRTNIILLASVWFIVLSAIMTPIIFFNF